jgi:hypothetical protein
MLEKSCDGCISQMAGDHGGTSSQKPMVLTSPLESERNSYSFSIDGLVRWCDGADRGDEKKPAVLRPG